MHWKKKIRATRRKSVAWKTAIVKRCMDAALRDFIGKENGPEVRESIKEVATSEMVRLAYALCLKHVRIGGLKPIVRIDVGVHP